MARGIPWLRWMVAIHWQSDPGTHYCCSGKGLSARLYRDQVTCISEVDGMDLTVRTSNAQCASRMRKQCAESLGQELELYAPAEPRRGGAHYICGTRTHARGS